MKKAKLAFKTPLDDFRALESKIREENASHQRWIRIDRQLDRMEHRIDRLDRALECFDNTNKRMAQLLAQLEAIAPRKEGPPAVDLTLDLVR